MSVHPMNRRSQEADPREQFYTRQTRFTIVGVSLLPVLTQVIYLSHTLLNTKPFKLMSDPSPKIFAAIAVVASALSIAATTLLAARLRRSLVPAVPILAVIVVAAIWLLTFWAFTALDQPRPVGPRLAGGTSGVQEVVTTRSDRLAHAWSDYGRKVGMITLLTVVFGAIAGAALRSIMGRIKPAGHVNST